MEVKVEKITTKEQQDIAFEIRKQVFVIEQNVDEEEEYDEFEQSSVHFLVKADGIAAGTARWRFTEKGIKLERFAILEAYRSRGLGSAIVQAVLADLPSDKKLVYLHAQLPAIPLYSKYGFKITGPQFTEAGIEHLKMVLNPIKP